MSSAATAWERAAAHAHKAGETGRRADALAWVAATHLFGPTRPEEAVRELREIGQEVAGSAAAESALGGILASCVAMGGHDREAREVLSQALEMWREHGLEADLANYGCQYVSWVERCAGNPDAELRAWIEGLEASRRLDQENRFLASGVALLLAARGEVDEAVTLVNLAHPGDWAGNLHMRFLLLQASAILDARRGNAEGARRQVREATDMMGGGEFLVMSGDAWMSTALVERLLSGDTASDAAVEAALELYRRKGATALIAPARSWQQERSGSVL